MQSKGLIRLFAILLALASIWQLSFTAVTRIQEKKAAKVAAEKAQQFVDANNVAAEVREFVLDSVATIRNRAYIDSISSEKVYLGYTYQSAKEKEINLGLDLKGGMNVMLQVQLEDLVKAILTSSRRSSSRKRTTSIPARTSSACSKAPGPRPPTAAGSPRSSAPTSSVTRSSPSPPTRMSSRSSAAKRRAPSTTPSTCSATVSTVSASPSRTSSASRTGVLAHLHRQ